MRSNERSTNATKGAARSRTSGGGAAARLERWNSITWTDSRARTGTMSTGSGSFAARTTSMRRCRSTDGPSWNERGPRPLHPEAAPGIAGIISCPLATGGELDQQRQPALAGLRPLRGHHPVSRRSPVPRRLGAPDRASLRVAAQPLLQIRGERDWLLLERVVCRHARLEGLQPRRLHPPLLVQLADAADVHRAPAAARAAGREADAIRLAIHVLPDSVDPADAESLVDGLGPGDPRPPPSA